MTNRSQSIRGWMGVEDADRALVTRLKARSVDDWVELYSTYYEPLLRYSFLRLGSMEEAEDLASSVFTRALARIDNFRYEGSPVVGWLFEILKNLLKEERPEPKRHSRRIEQQVDFAAPERLHKPVTGIPDRIDFQQAMLRLTPAQQEVVGLLHVAGFRVKEVAAMLSKSERAIYYLEARALSRLRDELSLNE